VADTRSIEWSPDGKRLAFIASVPAGGYDLFEVPLDRASWQPARDYFDDRPATSVIGSKEEPLPRPYRPLESLAPQAWTMQLDSASRTASNQTGGSDAVGLHS
jgi:hypothetical protein